MDFTKPKKIGPGIEELKKAGKTVYDHCYALRSQDGKQAVAAKLTDPTSGRTMEVTTDQPGIQLYTGNFLTGGPETGGIKQHGALCLETQHYPDSPNHSEFATTVLKPGETYKTSTTYKFGVQ
jgi:aldose 1-epimerase